MKTEEKQLFTDVEDPRIVNKCDHKLQDILFIALSTLICNGEDFEDMVLFGEQNYDWLIEILELPNGIPSHDTFNRVLQLLEPSALINVLQEDGKSLIDSLSDKQICFDGKKLKGVSPKSKGNKGLFILTAWVSESRVCVGQQKVDDKSNEITAIPELLENIEIKDAVVSIDAIGCQKDIAEKIKSKEGDYLLALKENQKSSFQQVEEAFLFHKPKKFNIEKEKNHGREESRKCSIIQLEDLPEKERIKDWEGLKTLVKIEAERKIGDEKQTHIRYYLSSESVKSPVYYNMLVRGHWSVENELHWHLDVTFKEDASRARKGHSQENLNILRKIALQRINLQKDNLSKKKRRYKASMNNSYLRLILEI